MQTQRLIRWGILGLGNIAHRFAHDLLLSEGALLQGVASRDVEKAKNFATKFNAASHYGSYEALASDPDIDVVYIATPHPFHFEHAMLCLQQGKHVLCEKPMCMNANEAEMLIEESKRKGLFLMEGIWTRFIPATLKALELIEKDLIGKPALVKADFGFPAAYDPSSRLFNKVLGGGSLLDIGIYPVYLSLLLLGVPKDIQANASIAPTGVDAACTMLFTYADDAKAKLHSSFEQQTPTEAIIEGNKGSLILHRNFHHSRKISIQLHDGTMKTFEVSYRGNGYVHEIEEVQQCLLEERTESELLPLKTSLELAHTLDRVRAIIGTDS